MKHLSTDPPKISVIMPFYNAEDYLDLALQSILNQTFTSYELILINDSSNDNSHEVVTKYLSDQRIIYIRNNIRSGITKNLNHGLKIARADIIARMDGDDISDTSRFEKQYHFLIQRPEIVLIGSYFSVINEKGEILSRQKKPVTHTDIRKVCFYYGPFAHPAIMFRKNSILKIGGYRENKKYEYIEDIDLYFRVIFSGMKTANLPEYLLYYRYHSNNTSVNSRSIGIRSYNLKKECIKTYKLKLNSFEFLSIYFHYWLDSILTNRQKQLVESFVKKLLSIRLVGGQSLPNN